MSDLIMCPVCESTRTGAYLRKRKCFVCSYLFSPPKRAKGRQGRGQQLSVLQEKRNAKRSGGRQTVASGAKSDKADIVIEASVHSNIVRGLVREEDKVTTKKSYSLKLADLRTLQSQAQGDEIPVFAVGFAEERGTRIDQYMIVPEHWFRELLAAYRELHENNT